MNNKKAKLLRRIAKKVAAQTPDTKYMQGGNCAKLSPVCERGVYKGIKRSL
jgi:hypothetical protein